MKTRTPTPSDRKSLFPQAGAAILAAALCAPALAGDRAEVLAADPIIESYEVEVPHEVCRVESVRQTPQAHYGGNYSGNYGANYGQRSRTPGVVGAIIGGAIGNSVGRGKTNRRIGTAVGAILGGTIGSDISRRNHQRQQYGNRGYNSGRNAGYNQPVSYRREQVCRITHDYRTEERINGYAVTYVYAGQTYNTVLDHDPGRYLEVNVQVTPAG